jgi:hypothetical protein
MTARQSGEAAERVLQRALGKRSFLLRPGLATEWRWLQAREDSPWYPHAACYAAQWTETER